MPHFGTVQNPIKMMMHEHDIEGARFRTISELTNNYTVPEDGCTTYKVTLQMLEAFENDLHKHIHLENNILFPKALSLENNLLGKY
jgi:regulator of cell morphogenesis and NO signaling